MTDKTGGPAFPYEERNREGEPFRDYFGMTLRDYFAAKAMQGVCASGPSAEWTNHLLAKEAYSLADAMLKAREQE